MAEAAKPVGSDVSNPKKTAAPSFSRANTQASADAGVPAHAVIGCFIFPDYHRPGDEWQKLDYDNMAQLTRVSDIATWRMANNPSAPAWNQTNAKAAQYVKAAEALYGAK